MKFLHTSDLHLGKQLHNVSFLEDQRLILDQLADLARTHEVDGVIIAGDVYQKSAPQAEAMALFDQFLTRLTRFTRVFVISGNHDSQQRVSYLSGLVENSGAYIARPFDGRLQTITLEDAFGPLDVHLLPFIKPVQARRYLPEAEIDNYEDAMRAILAASCVDPGRRNLLVCHQFITGAETSDSEEMSVGGLEHMSAGLFDMFDYVALGHIHKPQKMLRDTLRYAGSPLKYSFSEVSHPKSAVLVDMRARGDVSVTRLPLTPLHDMRLVEGDLADVMAMPYSEDYVWVTIHDELPPPDARVSVSTVFPNMLKFSVSNSKTKTDIDVMARESMEKKSVAELFRDFYRLQNNDADPGDTHMQLLEEILKQMEESDGGNRS